MWSGNTADELNKRQVNPNPKSPLVVLREHIIINDKRIVDILKQYDEHETYNVSTEDFAKALKVSVVHFPVSAARKYSQINREWKWSLLHLTRKS